MSDKFQIISAPMSLPGHCFFCRSSDRPPRWLDTSMYVEFEGAIYICEYCMVEMASKYDMVLPETYRELKDKYDILVEAFDDLLKGYKDVGDNCSGMVSSLSTLHSNYNNLLNRFKQINSVPVDGKQASNKSSGS